MLPRSRWALCPPPLQAAASPHPLQPVGLVTSGTPIVLPLGTPFLTVHCGTHAPWGLLWWTSGLAITFCHLWPQGKVRGDPHQARESPLGAGPVPQTWAQEEASRGGNRGPASHTPPGFCRPDLASRTGPRASWGNQSHQPKVTCSAGPLTTWATRNNTGNSPRGLCPALCHACRPVSALGHPLTPLASLAPFTQLSRHLTPGGGRLGVQTRAVGLSVSTARPAF